MRFRAISRAVVAVSPLFLSEMHSEGNDSSTPIQNNVQFPSYWCSSWAQSEMTNLTTEKVWIMNIK